MLNTDKEKLRKECIDLLNCSVYSIVCEYCNRDAAILVKRAEQVKILSNVKLRQIWSILEDLKMIESFMRMK